MTYTETGHHEPEFGEGAFSIVFPGPLFTHSRRRRPTAAYKTFRDSLHTAVGDPERQRSDITQAIGRLARGDARGDNVLRLYPGKGVTIVDPQTLVEEARYSVRDCGPVIAAALGEIVSALQDSTVNVIEAS